MTEYYQSVAMVPETMIGGSTHYYKTKLEAPPTFCPHIDNYGFPNPIKNDYWKNFAHKTLTQTSMSSIVIQIENT